MQFTDEVDWSPFDYMIAGILLFGTGLVVEFVLRKVRQKKYRIVVIVALLIVFLLTWAELGVGLFGLPLSGN